MARRAGDPLPVFKVGGIVRLNSNDLEDWLSRQRDRSMRVPHVTSPSIGVGQGNDDVGLRLIAKARGLGRGRGGLGRRRSWLFWAAVAAVSD